MNYSCHGSASRQFLQKDDSNSRKYPPFCHLSATESTLRPLTNAPAIIDQGGNRVQIIHTATHALPSEMLTGITDLEIRGGPVPVLYVASEVGNGITAWKLQDGTSASLASEIAYAYDTGTFGIEEITLATVAGQDVLLPSGSRDNRLAIHRLDDDGSFASIKELWAPSEQIGHFTNAEVIQLDGKTFMVSSQAGVDGFSTFRVRDDLSLEYRRHFDDNDRAHISTVEAMASASFHTRSFFFVASAAEDGVTAYWMGKWGNVRERGTLDAGGGLSIDAPTALETAEIGGRLYLIVAGSGSGTLSIIQVNQWGGLFPKDHLLDDLSTRFDGVTALETVTVGQHTYLFAGGSDDGISMFEITADGQLHHLLTLEDQLNTTLTNIAAIAATVVGTELQLYVSGSEAGVTQFTVDLGAIGDQIVGSDTHDVIHGTANDDVIVGFDGNDSLFGGDGDDRIIDGAGVDTMTGENGADIFVFRQDRRMDNVMDFQDGIDKLDLTDFAMLYSIDQLTFVQKLYGVEISFGSDRFHIESENGQLLITDLTADDFIF